MKPGTEDFHVAVKAALFDALNEVREGILEDVNKRVDSELQIFKKGQDTEHAKTRAFVAVASVPAWGKAAAGALGAIGFGGWHILGLGTWLTGLF